MKKRIAATVVALSAVMSMGLSGCANQAKPQTSTTAPGEAVQLVSEEIVRPDYTPTVKEVCDAYLSGDTTFADYYEVIRDDDGIKLSGTQNDGYYYPGATLSTDDWTAEEIVDIFRNHPESWKHLDDFDNVKGVLYSQDYATTFWYRDDWIKCEEVRIAPFDPTTYDLTPTELLKAYQSDAWDGSERLSGDYSTTARIDWTGGLFYAYMTNMYEQPFDNFGIMYTGYDETPIFRNFTDDIKVLEDYRHDDCIYANVLYYPDLPNGQKDGIISSFRKNETTTSFLFQDGMVEQYSKGKLVQSWSCGEVNEDSFLVDIGTLYAQTANRTLQLNDDGTTEVITDGQIIDAYYNYESHFEVITINAGGELCFWSMFRYPNTVLANNVRAAQLAKGYIWFTDTEGMTSIIKNDSSEWKEGALKIIQLGNESIEFYQELLKDDEYEMDNLIKEYGKKTEK